MGLKILTTISAPGIAASRQLRRIRTGFAALLVVVFFLRGTVSGADVFNPWIEQSIDLTQFNTEHLLDGAAKPEIAPSLATLLNKRIAVSYRRSFLAEVASDLYERAGLHVVMPEQLERAFTVTLNENGLSLKKLLELLATEGGLDVEYDRNTVVFWKKSEDTQFAELVKKLKNSGVQERCETIYDLAKLSDKRIYPFLFAALQDADDMVVATSARELRNRHLSTLRYGDNVRSVIDVLIKRISAPGSLDQKCDLVYVLGGTGTCDGTKQLTELLRSPGEKLRIAAMLAICATGDACAVESLISMLKDPSPSVRDKAVDALGLEFDPRTLPYLMEASNDSEGFVRAAAAFALGSCTDSRATERLGALLKDNDENVRISAAISLGRISGIQSADLLLASLSDEKELFGFEQFNVGDYVAKSLGKLADTQIVDKLLNQSRDARTLARNNAIYALGYCNDARLYDVLAGLLLASDPAVRGHAALALGNIGRACSIEKVAKLLKDKDNFVRTCAVNALGRICDSRVIEQLSDTATHDSDWGVRTDAVLALGATRDPLAFDPLSNCLNDLDFMPRSCVFDAITFGSLLQYPRAIELFEAMVNIHETNTLCRGALGLACFDSPHSIERLVNTFMDKEINDGDAEYILSYIFQMSRNPRIVTQILARLPKATPELRARAAKALAVKDCMDPRTLGSLIAMMSDQDDSVRAAVAGSLAEHLHDATKEGIFADTLIPLLRCSDLLVRLTAADTLFECKNNNAQDVVMSLLKHSDPKLRSSAVRILGRPKYPENVSALIEMLTDRDPIVRCSAVDALPKTQDSRVSDALARMFSDEDESVRQNAARAFTIAPNPHQIASVALLAKNPDAKVRAAAAYALGEVHDRQKSAIILSLLKDNDQYVRLNAVQAVGRLERFERVHDQPETSECRMGHRKITVDVADGLLSPECVEALITMLKDGDIKIRNEAVMKVKLYASTMPQARAAIADYENSPPTRR